MRPEDRLRDKWMWNWELLRFCVALPVAIAIVLAVAFYPALGPYSLLYLLFSLIGLLVGIIYGVVGRKVRSLKDSMSTEGGEIVESLIVDGWRQSPGVAVLRETELVLAPIVGSRRTVKLGEIQAIRSVRFFNGKGMLWKKWLVLSTSPRLGFAVPDTIARRWASRLATGVR